MQWMVETCAVVRSVVSNLGNFTAVGALDEHAIEDPRDRTNLLLAAGIVLPRPFPCACRVDVGMSRGCGGGSPQALEIIDDKYLFQVLENGSRVPINPQASENSGWSPANWFRIPVPAS
jgi:hypothetical protein